MRQRIVRRAPVSDPPPLLRARLAGIGALVATVAILFAGGWGIWQLAAEAGGAQSARVGTWVVVQGGTLRVDRVEPVVLPQHSTGMTQAAGMDMIPAGERRIKVYVRLHGADGDGLAYSSADFRLLAQGKAPLEPRDAQIPSGVLLPGTEVSGTLTFQFPAELQGLALSFSRGSQAIALDLAALPTPDADHQGHGGGSTGSDGAAPKPTPTEHSSH